jgi:UDP-glucose 4-epimerase
VTRRALVTGGAGFIGSHISDLFLSNGWSVDILDNLSSGRRENVPSAAKLHVMDIRSPEAAALVSDGSFDVIAHLAAQIDVRKSVNDPAFDASVNVLGALNLVEAMRRSTGGGGEHTRFVFASTGGALYGDHATPPNVETIAKEPDSPYGIAKLSTELYLSYYARVQGMNMAAVRFSNVYGPRQDPHGEAGVVAIFCQRILAGRPLTVFGDGTQTRDYVHVSDVAAATYAAATKSLPQPRRLDDRAFNVGTGVATSVIELAEVLRKAAGSTTPIDFAPKRPGEQQQSFLTVEKAKADLGWSAKISIEEGLADTFRWFSANTRTQ